MAQDGSRYAPIVILVVMIAFVVRFLCLLSSCPGGTAPR